MFSKKKKIELSDEEFSFTIRALNDYRTKLIEEEKYTDVVNELMIKLKHKMKIDKYDTNAMINILYDKRKNLSSENQDTELVDDLLIRLIKISETFKK